MQEDSSVRRGRKPSTASDHPLGRLIRERRLARNWSIKELADQVGIGGNSWSLISEIERGRRAPSLEVAENLAHVLDIPAAPLLEWAETMRRVPRSHAQTELARSRYTSEALPQLERSLRITPQLWDQSGGVSTLEPLIEWTSGPARTIASAQQESEDDVPVFGPGIDPDGRGARPVAWVSRRHLPASLAEALVRPIAFVVSDEDFERLRRPIYGRQRPRFAVVSRMRLDTIDPREPYAVRRRGRVKLAYVAWDGRELLILPPAGRGRFDSASADGPRGLERRLVGQVVAMLGWG